MNYTIQIFLHDRWVDCARIDLDRHACRWDYEAIYAVEHTDTPVSLAEPVDLELRTSAAIPAFLFDLVPQGPGRRFLLGELHLPDAASADFPLIRAGAFDPIGRLRVAEAVEYLSAHVTQRSFAPSLPALTIDDVAQPSDTFKERMMLHGMLETGTTGIQGAAPKYLLTRDRAGLFHGEEAQGVDIDIIEFLSHSIDTQARQLKALQ